MAASDDLRKYGKGFKRTSGRVLEADFGTGADQVAPGSKLPGAIAIDTTGGTVGKALVHDGTKFAPGSIGGGGTPYGGTPTAVAAAGAAGASSDYARGDHVHAHGAQTDGGMHAVAVASGAAGFMSGADKAKLDAFGAASGYAQLAGAAFTGAVEVAVNDATAADLTAVLALSHTTSGTAAAGLGTACLFRAEDASGTVEDLAYVAARLTTATSGAETSRVEIATRTGGGALTVRVYVHGDGSTTFGNANPVGVAGAVGVPSTAGYYVHNGTAWVRILNPASGDLEVGTATTSRTLYSTATGIITNYASGGVTSWTPNHRFGDYAQTKYFAIISDGLMIAGASDGLAGAAAFTIRGPSKAGTNAAGVDLTIQGGLGTGNAAPGKVVIAGGERAASGTTVQSAVTLAEFQDTDTNDETCFLVRVRRGGVESVDRVTLGAADSGGAGKRALVVPN